jgi:NADPH-dependent 2,4-dienoyl-CoA reductase/sulfur reductase-like enzyme
MRRIVIVGGQAAGMTAAMRARRTDPHARITVLEAGSHASVGACGLPHWLAGIIPDTSSLLARRPDWIAAQGIELCTGHLVLEIDRAGRTVLAVDHASGQDERFPFDRLILCTGSFSPLAPAPGRPDPRLFPLAGLDHALALERRIEASPPPRGIGILGWGPRAWSLASALAQRCPGLCLLRPPEPHPHLSPGMERVLQDAIAAAGVRLERVGLPWFTSAPGVSPRRLDLQALGLDLLVVAGGYRPQSSLAREAGLRLGPEGGILVDRRLCTSDPGIFAAGDCCEAPEMLSGRHTRTSGALAANRAGRIAGLNAAAPHGHRRETWPGNLGTTLVRAFGLEIAWTGLPPAQAAGWGFQPRTLEARTPDRAGYISGGGEILCRLTWDRSSGRLLGGALLGPAHSAKRIDTLAVAVQARLTVDQLAGADLAYQPGISPVWDPLLIAARLAVRQP